LNSFLEQKIEHERLLKRVRTLQAQSTNRTLLPHQHQQDPSMLPDHAQSYLYPHAVHHTSHLNPHGYPLSLPSSINPSDSRFVNISNVSDRGTLYPQTGGPLTQHEEEEESRRKKSKKAPQYVCITCGRTDSPEWRKGPQGPKTLCNACGLRWAKKARKLEGAPDHSKLGT